MRIYLITRVWGYPHIRLTPIAGVVPNERSLHGGPRVACSLEEIERDTNDRSLHPHIIRLTARVAERKIGEHKAGNAALLDDVSSRANHHG